MLVTGAASGIGAAVARLFATNGARIVLTDIDEATVDRVGHAIRGEGTETLAMGADISDERQVERLLIDGVNWLGGLDAAINCAGVPNVEASPTHLLTLPEWERVLATNLTGLWLCMKYELDAMLVCGAGAIVNVTSRAGLKAARNMASYVASKHGAVGLTKAAALEYADRNIRVNALCPGPIATPMLDLVVAGDDALYERMRASIPVGRVGTADEVAQAALWLASDAASFITGVALPVDGGSVA